MAHAEENGRKIVRAHVQAFLRQRGGLRMHFLELGNQPVHLREFRVHRRYAPVGAKGRELGWRAGVTWRPAVGAPAPVVTDPGGTGYIELNAGVKQPAVKPPSTGRSIPVQ